MNFQPTGDMELVRRIMTDESVYPHITDDGCPAVLDFEPANGPGMLYVLVVEGVELLGLFLFVKQNSICWEVHTCLLPNAYGPKARRAAEEMADWLWRKTPCERLVTSVPITNPLAGKFAVRAGMEQFGKNPRSFLKHGQLVDQLLLGMSKPERKEGSNYAGSDSGSVAN